MELKVRREGVRAEGDEGQSFVAFEGDRIAQRRVFEDDQGALSKDQVPIQ